MGQTCSTLAFGIGAKLGPKCKCCCFCSPFLSDGKLATGAIRDGHLVWDSCWCQCCHICCDAEKAVAEKIVNRQPNPAPFICVEPGSSGPLTFAEYDAKVIQEGSNPPFSGKFRANDGGGNNKKYPWVGQGGRPYGQMTWDSDAATKAIHKNFDIAELMKLIAGPRETFVPHASNTSAFISIFAFLVVHDLFRSDTGRGDDGDGKDHVSVNVNSSYLDLSPIYGYNTATQHAARTMEQGKLKDNYVADNRLKRLHPARAILLLFVREHNYVCDKLAEKYPKKFQEDEIIFQQARLIITGVWASVILEGYGGCFFGGRGILPPKTVLPSPRGKKMKNPVGFASSIEFKYMYQWHGIVPEWTAASMGETHEVTDVDAELTRLVTTPAGDNGVKYDVKAIELSRQLNIGSFNDFSEAIGGKRCTTFEEFTDDTEIIAALKKAYPTPDDVEFYIGCRVQPRPLSTETFSFGNVVAFAILSDAMSCMRHDRFHTIDFTPAVYTPWGYKHARTTSVRHLLKRHTSLPVTDIDVTTVQSL